MKSLIPIALFIAMLVPMLAMSIVVAQDPTAEPTLDPLQALPTTHPILDCPLPEGYREGILDELTAVGETVASVNTADPAEVSLFFVSIYQIRHRYENMTPEIPNCALRGHAVFTNILGNWEDILGLTLAAIANPEAADQYIAEIDVLNDRIQFFAPILLDLFFPPVPPTPVPPSPTEPVILSTFYVNTEGLSVRAGPGPDFERVGLVTGGTAIEVVALDTLDGGDVWYQIIFPDSETGLGWVFGGLVSPERPEAFPEPLPTDALPTETPQGAPPAEDDAEPAQEEGTSPSNDGGFELEGTGDGGG